MAACNKFWVALVVAGAEFLRIRYGLDLGMDEATAAGIVGAVTAGLVWLVPNR